VADVRIRVTVRGGDCRTALALVTDYTNWARASESVRSVTVERDGDGWSTSFWEVVFRGGLMRWSERDHVELDANRESFELIEGDPHAWRGGWTAEQHGDDCVLTMVAQFDLGMPSLGHVLDPIAIEALEDAVADVARGLFGEDVELALGDEVEDAPVVQANT
jgi:hypothetical protein